MSRGFSARALYDQTPRWNFPADPGSFCFLILEKYQPPRNDFIPPEKCSGHIGVSIFPVYTRILCLEVTSDRPKTGTPTPAPGLFGSRRKNLFRKGSRPSQSRMREFENRSSRLDRAKIRSIERSDRQKIKNETPMLVPARDEVTIEEKTASKRRSPTLSDIVEMKGEGRRGGAGVT